MAAIVKTIVPSLATKLPCTGHRSQPLVAGEDIAAGDCCYIKTDGLVYRSIGTAVNAAAKVHGWATIAYIQGQPVTLYNDVDLAYGPSNLTPGAPLYVSTTAGQLETAPTTGGTGEVAFVVTNNTKEGTPHSVIRVHRSAY